MNGRVGTSPPVSGVDAADGDVQRQMIMALDTSFDQAMRFLLWAGQCDRIAPTDLGRRQLPG
jgi:hypothetical protein